MKKAKTKLLIIDDDAAIRQSLRLLFSRYNFEIEDLSHPSYMMDTIAAFQPHLIVLDMNYTLDTSGRQGMKVLKEIRSVYQHIPIILITGWATVQLAVEGMKEGANDFFAKPWDNKALIKSAQTLTQIFEQEKVTATAATRNHWEAIIGESPALLQAKLMAERVSRSDASVLLQGESGTGKELFAEAIHYASARKERPFVKVNLGGISSSLFESELFGHKKGAYTGAISDRVGRFQKADTGTIFLDELGELSPENQVKLLRVLQEQQFEVLGSSQTIQINTRVISATHQNLINYIQQGRFREDLYYRINLVQIFIPSLSERRSDIPLLSQHFVKNLNSINQTNKHLSPEALDWLSKQSYPGNIRQLKNSVERTYLLTDKDRLTDLDFKKMATLAPNYKSTNITPLEQLEQDMIIKALRFYSNNISQAATALGITRSSLYRRIEKHGLEIGE